MDEAEQALAYAHADFAEPNERFVGYFETTFPHLRAGNVLDLGCGPGDIVLRLASRHPGLVVHGLDHLEVIVPTFAELGRRHARIGVTDGHYDTVGAALLWMLEQRLGSGWTPEAKAAWSGAYALLAGVMRGAR